MNRLRTGTVEGTGAAISVTLGFIPNYVKLMNIDGIAMLEWTPEIGAGKGLKTADSGTAKCDISYISTGGVTVSASTDTYIGFSIGTDTDINVNGETICWVASADRDR